jgi:molybdate transport system ATP-binding protein
MSGTGLELDLTVPLDRFDLRIRACSQSRVLGVFGPSGAGKTTLLEALAGWRSDARGVLRRGGECWLDSDRGLYLRPEQRGIGYVPQDHLLFPHRDVRANLAFGTTRGSGGHGAAPWDEVVATLELGPLLDRRVESLSGGERQRVALGRALCSGPRLLLLDEPLASLDAPLRHRILPFLLRVRERFAVPMLIVSHNTTELLALCDELLALEQGQVVAQGEPTAVLTRPELYPAAAREGFENILPARVGAVEPHRARLHLGGDGAGPGLTVYPVSSPAGAAVTVGLPARDLLVATRAVTDLSARNCLPATVRAIEMIGAKVLLRADLEGVSGPPLVVELTRDALEDLALAPGRAVWLLIKSSAVTVYL